MEIGEIRRCNLLPMDLRDRITAAREHAKLSRRELGALFDPPITYETVRSWESGDTEPRLSRFEILANVTNVRLAWLLMEYGPMLQGEVEIIPPDVIAASLRKLSLKDRAAVLADAFESSDKQH